MKNTSVTLEHDVGHPQQGDNFCVALKSDGTIIGWGHDNQNVLTNIPVSSIF